MNGSYVRDRRCQLKIVLPDQYIAAAPELLGGFRARGGTTLVVSGLS